MCLKCDYGEYLDMCYEMLDDIEYSFAFDTINGIKNWVEEKRHITDKQKSAIENIFNSKNDKEDEDPYDY
jgi:hypothetical protein